MDEQTEQQLRQFACGERSPDVTGMRVLLYAATPPSERDRLLEAPLAKAATHAWAFDVLVSVGAFHAERDDEIPQRLARFAAGVAAGKRKRPRAGIPKKGTLGAELAFHVLTEVHGWTMTRAREQIGHWRGRDSESVRKMSQRRRGGQTPG